MTQSYNFMRKTTIFIHFCRNRSSYSVSVNDCIENHHIGRMICVKVSPAGALQLAFRFVCWCWMRRVTFRVFISGRLNVCWYYFLLCLLHNSNTTRSQQLTVDMQGRLLIGFCSFIFVENGWVLYNYAEKFYVCF